MVVGGGGGRGGKAKTEGALLLSKRDLVEMLAAQLTAAKEVKVVFFFPV